MWLVAGGVAVAGIALAACGAPVEVGPSDLATPDIRWAGGEPSGPLESDPWVQAVRASEMTFALAVNAHDFSDPDLWRTKNSNFVDDAQADLISRATTDQADLLVVLSPFAFEPVRAEVDPSEDRATVVVCEFSGSWVSLQDRAVDVEASWEYRAYEVVRGDDRHLRVAPGSLPQDILDSGRIARSFVCEPSQRSIGWFDPAPVVTPFGPEDVVKGAPPGGASPLSGT